MKARTSYGVSDSWWNVPPAEDSECRFIERLKARDERAFNELVEAYEYRVFRLVHRMLGRRDEAEVCLHRQHGEHDQHCPETTL